MQIDEEYILNLPNNANRAVLKIIRDVEALWEGFDSQEEADFYEDTFIDALALLQFYTKEKEIDYNFDAVSTLDPNWLGDFRQLANNALGQLEQMERESKHSRSKEKVAMLMGREFSYTFTDGDLQKLRKLISELKKTIEQTEEIESDHKKRLIKRLNELESELSKSVSNLDKYYGLLVEANVLVSKIGTVSKPIVSLIRGVVDIVWSTHSNAEELPSNTHLSLPAEDDEV